MAYQTIIFEQETDIGIVTLNRPDAKNAISLDVMSELVDCFKTMSADPSIKAVVITGGPNVFSAGFHMPHAIAAADFTKKNEMVDLCTECFLAVLKFRAPVIAAVSGPALAAGFDLQVMADFRVYSETAKVGQVEINVAVTPLMDPLWKIVGLGVAKELTMTGRVYGAQEAYRIGLANYVYPVETFFEEAKKMAHHLAKQDPYCMQVIKEQSNRIPGMELDQAMVSQLYGFRHFVGSPEMVRRMTAFLNKMK
ncbi:MAG: enoyl-CoA hydratase/isomerase family protein [Solirubrobacterales bacterium]